MSNLSSASRRVLVAVAALTLLGLALRLARYGQTILGDETSTLYIVKDRSLGEVLDLVSSDAEISPPFYFILAWLSTKLGAAPELVRLPSLIAGTISIPLVYLVGARALNRNAGLIAAAVFTLTPFMIFYSADGRGYAVAIAFLLGSTLAMLAACRDGGTRWWVVYGVLSLLAMYTHYTTAFVLVAQLGWLFWAHPEARRPALIANVAAAVLYLPWLPGLIGDTDSPTIEVLSHLQGDGFAAKRVAVEAWAVGYPFQAPRDVPGAFAGILGLAGFVVAAIASLLRRVQLRAAAAAGARPALIPKGAVLVLAMAVATAVFEALILFTTGNDLFGARNLTTSSAGLALLIGAVLAGAGRLWGTICTIAVLACFSIGTARALSTDSKLLDFEGAAAYIEAESAPDAVVVDFVSSLLTPVPLTSLDAYLEQTRPEYRILQPQGPPPYLPGTPTLPPKEELREAVRTARESELVVVVNDDNLVRDGDEVKAIKIFPLVRGSVPAQIFPMPPGSRVVAERRFEALGPVNVVTIEVGSERPE